MHFAFRKEAREGRGRARERASLIIDFRLCHKMGPLKLSYNYSRDTCQYNSRVLIYICVYDVFFFLLNIHGLEIEIMFKEEDPAHIDQRD